MKFSSLIRILDEIAPLKTQEEWDNSGLQISCGNAINTVLVCMEITDKVIEEAISLKSDMIITHHPMFFSPLKCIDMNDAAGKQILKLIKNNISVYSCHTPFDKAKYGTNYYFLKKLGASKITFADEYTAAGFLPKTTRLSLLAERISKLCGVEGMVKVIGSSDAKIKKIAVCTGAGGEFYKTAQTCGADAFISGDMKHHMASEIHEQGFNYIDAGHWGTEQFFTENFAGILKKKTKNQIKVFESKINQNPFDFSV